ncbi:MAG: metal ABC transporter substrate-binding protein [Verrucomicrobiota bacterium JB023]|nr:metal ABC transporter substrate-binding protein [Verrucomicrobiota bacterium JB023]
MMKRISASAALLLFSASAVWGDLTVGSLHPLMADVARQVGGDKVKVVEVGKVGMDAHSFEPTPEDIKDLSACALVLASGKGLESYLDSLEDGLAGIPIHEVGKTLPSRELADGEVICTACAHGGHDHHHHHHHHAVVDPHWWHSVDNMERATRVVARIFSQADPDNAEFYAMQGRNYRDQLKALDAELKAEVTKIPEEQRKLVTAHAAFGYFCEAYGFEGIYVLGLSGDHEVAAKDLAEEISKLKQAGVKAVFPEKNLNPKVLAQIANELGARKGRALIADGLASDYEEMMRSNVASLVEALAN